MNVLLHNYALIQRLQQAHTQFIPCELFDDSDGKVTSANSYTLPNLSSSISLQGYRLYGSPFLLSPIKLKIKWDVSTRVQPRPKL